MYLRRTGGQEDRQCCSGGGGGGCYLGFGCLGWSWSVGLGDGRRARRQGRRVLTEAEIQAHQDVRKFLIMVSWALTTLELG